MKKVIFLTLALSILTNNLIIGQTRTETNFLQRFNFGLRAGGNLSTIWYSAGADQCSKELADISSTRTFVPRYFIGGHSEISIRHNMSITVGAQYIFKGGGEDFNMPNPANPSQRINGKLENRVHYLQIPIQYNFKLKKYNLGVGGYWAHVLSGEQIWDFEDSEPQTVELIFGDKMEHHMRKTDFGIDLELGYRLNKNFQIFAHYQRGLSTQLSEANKKTFESLGYDWRSNHRAYGVGLTFFIPKKG